MARIALGKRTRSARDIGMPVRSLRETTTHTVKPETDFPSKRPRRQTRSHQINDENSDPETTVYEDENIQGSSPVEITEESLSRASYLDDDSDLLPKKSTKLGNDTRPYCTYAGFFSDIH